MELKRFKEKNPKKVGIILFTISCILLITGVILYRTFAIFQVNENQNMIEGNIQDEGDIRFMVYIDDVLQKDVPSKESGYSLDTSTSYCDNGDLISWNDERWSVELKNISTTKTKCYLKFKQIYKEEILNGAIPDLGNGRLIPVKISDTEKPSDVTEYTNAENNYGGKVIKADITDTDDPWYSYTNKKWANAVILKDGKVDNYQPGDEIKEGDIESYLVWIPRYRYQLKDDEEAYNLYVNKGNSDVITPYFIKFESKNEGISSGSTQNSWLTHPAFLSFTSNGMWVGKFETGYADAIDTNSAQQNSQESDKIVIKPNMYSWGNISVGNAFYASYNYLRELESHMMKNSEWGAVFYLTYSIYGRCNETSCTELRINNNGNYITGYSANFDPTCGYTETNEECNKYEENIDINEEGKYGWNYNNSSSVVASTTNNYSGIYDMSGGANEYVMGVMQGSNNNSNPASGSDETNNSGFNGLYTNIVGEKKDGMQLPSTKYYDLYDYNTSRSTYQRGHLGDATKELGPFSGETSSFFLDKALFVHKGFPWFTRGGDAGFNRGTLSGLGNFYYGHGGGYKGVGFRIVLTP